MAPCYRRTPLNEAGCSPWPGAGTHGSAGISAADGRWNLEALMLLERNGLQKDNVSIGVVATLFGDSKDVVKMAKNNLTDWDESSRPDLSLPDRYAYDASY